MCLLGRGHHVIPARIFQSDADETRIEVEGGTNYAVGVLEDGVIKLVDYSYRSPDEARQAWPQLGVVVVEGMSSSETKPLALPVK